MLKVRLIPSLLLRDGRCIKTKQFESPRDTGDPVTASKIYDAQGADELLFLDITASSENRGILFNIIERVSNECFMPLTVGGGVRNVEDIRRLLKIGSDKVAVCSSFVENPDFINEASRTFGASTIIGIIAYRRLDNDDLVFIHGKARPTPWRVIDWARELERRGVGEILLHSIDRDGMMTGYDIALAKEVRAAVTIPLIISGGAGRLSDFTDAVREARVSAISAGSIFHFSDQNLIKVRAYMKNAGVDVRSV